MLSTIALVGVLGTVYAVMLLSVSNNQRQLHQSAHKYTHEIEVALLAIENDLLATAQALDYVDQPSLPLRDFLARQPHILYLHIVDANGDIVLARQRISKNTHFQPGRALAPAQNAPLMYSSVYTNPENVPMLDIAAPVTQGRLVATIDLTSFWDIVRDIEYGQTGYAYIVNGDGQLLVYRDLALVQQGTRVQLPLEIHTQIDETPPIGAHLRVKQGINDQYVLASAIQLPNIPWILTVEQPITETIGGFYVLAIISVSVILVIISLVVSTNQFVRQHVVSPLVLLRERVNNFREGNFKQQFALQDHPKNEITMLGHTFNQMAGSIDQYTQELMVARAKALESSRLKSEFLSTISHELRTPLNAIIGYCDLMLEGLAGEFDAETRRMLTRIDASSGRLLSLIEDLLDLSKIEAGKLELASRSFQPAQLVQNWEAEHQVMAAKKNLQFVTHIDPALPTTLYGDPDRITQVATNLITNALKFTDQGSVTVTVSYNKTEWTISVADTGIGIPEHAQAYIFDAFRQGDSSTTREHGGTGLGLSIVHNLCALMGGSIAVTSKPGSGSTFTVHLPLMTQALAE